MKKIMGVGAMLLAGLLVMAGNFGLAGKVWAQSQSGTISDQQMEELRKKREEQWQDAEQRQQRLQDAGTRKQDALKRQQDALKRQKAAEQRLRELEKEGK